MTDLGPIPFADLVSRMRHEFDTRQSIFDLPVRKWYVPDEQLDFSAVHISRRASTPVGPAAGPHTQLAQNLVLSWLAGSRILELKTVQIDDQLEIPRPCIHVPNIGYNVEWSQELAVEESILEYAKATFLIEILKHTRAFGVFPERADLDTVFDISVGYDLQGIRSDKVTGFVESLKAPATVFDGLREQLGGDHVEYRDLPLPPSISGCVTLSTFHGCPAGEIESIARYLIEDLGLDTIIKLNPTLLGYERVKELLVDELGYADLELKQQAFDDDLQYDDGIEMFRRLRTVAEARGTTIGAKFTNTLVVANNPTFFPTQRDPYMYVSGEPLHVISMTLMQQFREDLGFELPVSFSAGVNARNFPDAVACGMVPITTCTDLLRPGGYGRLPAYLRALARKMNAIGVTSREAFVLSAEGRGAEAVEAALGEWTGGRRAWSRDGDRIRHTARAEPDRLPQLVRESAVRAGLDAERVMLKATRVAGRLNGRALVPLLAGNRRYHRAANAKNPRRIESRLGLYDCINCDLCIPACPNDAMFSYEVEPVEVETTRLVVEANSGSRREPGTGFRVAERHQLAVVEAACNECSNCEVYCPEEGAPWAVKERVFLTREQFARNPTLDGFCRLGTTLLARVDGEEMRLDVSSKGDRGVISGDGFRVEIGLAPLEVLNVSATRRVEIDTATFWRITTAWQSIFSGPEVNMVRPRPAPA